MIPIPVAVCVLGGWCVIYLADTLLKVRAAGAAGPVSRQAVGGGRC